jgi:uncharacterized protein (TIGR03083 family)
VSDFRDLFGAACVDVNVWLADQAQALEERFARPSALAELTVRALAGHLLRAMTTVETYLDASPPAPPSGTAVLSAAGYYGSVLTGDTDLDSDFNRAIRQRAVESAPDSAPDFVLEWTDTAARLVIRLEQEPEDRLVQVFGGHVLRLDDYLVTRLVEVVVHVDDLAVSLEVTPPELPAAATGLVIDTLVAVARARRGDTAVVRALTRRERDTVEALRVI